MDHGSIEKLERNMKAMGGKPIGEDDENIIWQLPNGIRWPIPKRDKSIVLSEEQKVGKAPVPKKQIIIWTKSPVVERPLAPTVSLPPVVPEPEEYLVRRVEATSSHYVNRTAPPKIRKKGREKGQENRHKVDIGHSLSPGFLEEANKILKKQGRAAAQEFIRSKRDLWSTR